MAIKPLSASLTTLAEYLDSLSARAELDRLGRLLRELDLSYDDVRDYACFDETTYKRNLICEGPWYQMLALCWRSGQGSPIHNHAQSVCGLRVLHGVMTETVYAHTPTGRVREMHSRELGCGGICVTHDDDTHKIWNSQPAGQDLVTLHIYSPPLVTMQTYSTTDDTVGTFAGTPAGAARGASR